MTHPTQTIGKFSVELVKILKIIYRLTRLTCLCNSSPATHCQAYFKGALEGERPQRGHSLEEAVDVEGAVFASTPIQRPVKVLQLRLGEERRRRVLESVAGQCEVLHADEVVKDAVRDRVLVEEGHVSYLQALQLAEVGEQARMELASVADLNLEPLELSLLLKEPLRKVRDRLLLQPQARQPGRRPEEPLRQPLDAVAGELEHLELSEAIEGARHDLGLVHVWGADSMD